MITVSQICGLIPEKATLFKSSLMPAKLTFRTVSGGEYVTIFKNGDDLRQDQLILQVSTFGIFWILILLQK